MKRYLVAAAAVLALTACGPLETGPDAETPSSTSVNEQPVAPDAPMPSSEVPAPAPAAGTALAALQGIPVRDVQQTGYDRDLFGESWADVDQNGCDTRIICT